MRLIFSQNAFRQLSKLEKGARKRIVEKLKFYASQKNPLAFAEKLTDARFGEWRFRVGEYRALFDVSRDKIIILKIGHRKEIYK